MIVSLCPTFFCNQKCSYCYLGNLRNDKSILDLNILSPVLSNITCNINNIEIFGGEISLLSKDYLNNLKSICLKYCQNIFVITNMTYDISDIFDNITFSLNEEREDYLKIKNNLMYYEKPYNLSIVVLPSVIKKGAKQVLESINYSNCRYVTFQKYSPSILNDALIVSDNDYENFLKDVIDYYIENKEKMYYNITNINDISNVYNGNYSPLMEENVFINYKGQYGCVLHNDNKEYFKWFDTFAEWLNETKKEKEKYKERCSNCLYYNHCYAEHLNFNKSCSGNKDLLTYFKGKL